MGGSVNQNYHLTKEVLYLPESQHFYHDNWHGVLLNPAFHFVFISSKTLLATWDRWNVNYWSEAAENDSSNNVVAHWDSTLCIDKS